MAIEITYNGERYNNLGDAFQQAIVDGYKVIINKKLEPFKKEIDGSMGTVTVDFTSDLSSASIKFSNVSKDLKDRIEAAMKV